MGYFVAAVVGSALVIGVAWLVGWLLARGKKDDQPPTATPRAA